MCDTWQAMCVTHDMPRVNMHDSFQAYIKGFTWAVHTSKESSTSICGSSKEQEEEGKREREERRREREERKGEREEKKRKGKKKREEKRKGREGKEREKGGSVA